MLGAMFTLCLGVIAGCTMGSNSVALGGYTMASVLLPMGWLHMHSLFADPSLLDVGCGSLRTLCQPIDLALGLAFTHGCSMCWKSTPLAKDTPGMDTLHLARSLSLSL